MKGICCHCQSPADVRIMPMLDAAHITREVVGARVDHYVMTEHDFPGDNAARSGMRMPCSGAGTPQALITIAVKRFLDSL